MSAVPIELTGTTWDNGSPTTMSISSAIWDNTPPSGISSAVPVWNNSDPQELNLSVAKPHYTAVTKTDGNVDVLTAIAEGQTISGVELEIGDFVLVTDQTEPTENGVYQVVDGAPAASVPPAPTWNPFIVAVESGDFEGSVWVNIPSQDSTWAEFTGGSDEFDNSVPETIPVGSVNPDPEPEDPGVGGQYRFSNGKFQMQFPDQLWYTLTPVIVDGIPTMQWTDGAP